MKRLRRWLRNPELIGAPDCPLMKRWTIYGPDENSLLPFIPLAKSLPWVFDRKLIVHYFLPDVEDRDPHDHPRGFWTFVLRGEYLDLVPCDFCKGLGSVIDPTAIQGIPSVLEDGEFPMRPRTTCWECEGAKVVLGDRMKPGTLRYRPATHSHITCSGPKGAWTVMLMGPFEREWGFWRSAMFWPFKKYEERFGFAMRCPTDEEREGRPIKYTDDGVVPLTRDWEVGVETTHVPYSEAVQKALDPVENAKAAAAIYREREAEKEEAFRDLAEVAYGSRDAIWTSPRTLVKAALAKAAEGKLPTTTTRQGGDR